jgi:predicted lipoprotein with Yx(FWY)xxD motif
VNADLHHRELKAMKGFLVSGAAVAAAVTLGACGSSGGDSSAGSSSQPAAPDSAMAVSVKAVNGVGRVLVDPSGKALYASDEEAAGKVLCTGACTSFWKPLAASGAKPTAPSGTAELGVIKRPDGSRQVTEDGKPLYTFSEDSAGTVKGNDFSDDFGGRHFTWHAVLAGGAKSSSGGGSRSSGGAGPYGY